MSRFKILVDYDSENVEVNKVSIVGGFRMPSLEMTDLLTDVINDLEEKESGSFDGYYNKIVPLMIQDEVKRGKK